MENTYSNSMHTYRQPGENISTPCVSLCFLIIVILGFLPVMPDRIVSLVKPVFLVLCVMFPGRGYYRFSFEKWLVILHIYLFGIWIANYQTNQSIRSYASMLLFALFFLFAGLRSWNRAEIRLLLYVLILSCTLHSVIAIYSNNGLLHDIGSQHISFLSKTLNRNSSAFAVTPGMICAIMMVFYGKKNPGIRAFYFLSALICFYAVVALACRSAFLSAVSGSFLVVWQATREHADAGRRFFRRIIFIVFVVALIFGGMSILEGTNSSRLFDYSDTGRNELWDVAWKLIKAKPVFGGGFDYWGRSGEYMSPHNTFLSIMLISGYIGGGILGLMMLSMLFECVKVRNFVALAFAMETVFHSISEAGLDYYAYIPLILTVILLRFSEYQHRDVSRIFR